MTNGQCRCGAVQYEIDGDLGETALCYCNECRRATGSAFSANVRVPRTRYHLKKGGELVREYESSPGVLRSFCGVCGGPVSGRLAADPDNIRIRLGALPADAPVRVVAHVWVSEKPHWYQITDALPQFAQHGDVRR